MITIEDVERALKSSLDEPEAIRRLRCISDTRDAVARYDLLRKQEYDRHDAKKLELATLLDNIQSGCEHENKSFFPDPAGGRDSYHQCNICRKEFP